MSAFLHVVDRGELGALIVLDLTAAFDNVDHDILLHRLQQTFGVDGNVHRWFRSYLVGRTQYTFVVVLYGHSSPVCCAVCRRDQFWGCCCSFCKTFNLIQLISHLYADDTKSTAHAILAT